ncbi:MAG: hypothetical protein HXY44_19010 [Syntrophaceae bacterium]|nr:hypothetical protein [Syntrophaceae bacterium]
MKSLKLKHIAVLCFLFLAPVFFFNEVGAQPLIPPEGAKPIKPGTNAPVIKHTFAVEKGHYGYIWKIYLEAEDPDGDMLRIASVVSQIGYGHYPTDWIYLKSPYQKHFKGYIQWNTFSSRTHLLREWTQIKLAVSVFDKAGNESNVVIFPFEFVSGGKGLYSYQLPPPFDQGNLPRIGNIHIDLFEPTLMGNGNARDD